MEAKPRDIEIHESFTRWMHSITGSEAYGRILTRLKRVEQGNLGDFSPVGDGVFELKFRFGKGPRVYFGFSGDKVIVLFGGMKDTQQRDIETAKRLWGECNA